MCHQNKPPTTLVVRNFFLVGGLFLAPTPPSESSRGAIYLIGDAQPLVRRTLQKSDVLISLTLAATVVAMANKALSDLDGPLRQINRARQRRLDAPRREP